MKNLSSTSSINPNWVARILSRSHPIWQAFSILFFNPLKNFKNVIPLFAFFLIGILPLSKTMANNFSVTGISVDDATVGTDFGTVQTGMTASLTYTITNNGPGGLMLGTITSSNPMFTINNYISSPLADGTSTTFEVEFAPNSVGAQNATISIVHSEGLGGTYDFAVTGEGLPSASDYFITTWETTTANESITIPTSGAGYNYSVDWGDGNTASAQSDDASHTYATAGIHTVKISGDFPRIIFNNGGDKLKIKSIEQWGTISWLTFKFAFKGAANLVYNATDAPDLSNVVNMEEMFFGATNFNGDLSNWDVSNVKFMKSLFKSANAFNGNISNWDVSSVTDMSYMFNPAASFNQDLNWDVSSVTNMSYMFGGATSFNGDISNWDVTNVTNMNSMFFQANSFNQPLNWTVTNVTKMKDMFANANSFNQTLNWDVSNVTNMANMFEEASSFDQDLGGWNISNVTTMKWMLYQAGLSTENYDKTLIGWAAQTVKPGVLLYSHTLEYCTGEAARNTLTAAPNNWVITGDAKDCPPLTFVTTWETTTDWESITIPTYGTGYNYSVDWGDGNTTTGETGDASHTYATAGTFTVSISGLFPRIYFNDAGDKDKIKSIEQWGAIKWSQMGNAFYGCSNLVYNATDAPNLSNVTSLHAMFRNATSFDGDLSNWDVSNITIMNNTFQGASSFNGNISNWDVAKVTNMQNAFAKASSFNQDLSSWDVSSVERMDYMFRDATSFNSSLASWDVSKCARFVYMFRNATSFNQDLSSWTFPTTMNVNMQGMFRHAISFDQNLGSWDISRVTNMVFFLTASGLSRENYDNTLIGWATQSVQPNVTLYSHTLEYCLGETAWNTLTAAPNNWTITGDVKNCPAGLIPFVTTWETTAANELIGFNAPGTAVFTVDWGDGMTSTNVSGNQTHSYATAGIYTMTISGDLQHFQQVGYAETNPPFSSNVKSIEQWGNMAWTSMIGTFGRCTNLVYNATDVPDLSNVENLQNMFHSCQNFNADISDWDVSNITRMDSMFYQANSFNQNLGSWNISNVISMGGMLPFTSLSIQNYDNTLIGWAAQSVQSGVVFHAWGLEYCIGETARNTLTAAPNNWSIQDAGLNCLPFITTWETTSDNEDIGFGAPAGAIFTVNWGDGMTSTDVSGNQTHTYATAGTYTVSISGDLQHFNMGVGTGALLKSVDQWGTIGWTSMVEAFKDCSNMVYNATDTPNLTNVTDMSSMFANASSFNEDISNWDFSNVTNISEMLSGATSFNQDLGSWNISNVTNMTNMLNNTALNTANYDNTLIGWATQTVQSGVNLGAMALVYCNGETARNTLTDAPNNWNITGDGLLCRPFITIWETTADNQAIGFEEASGAIFTIDWGDGNISTDVTGSQTHTYATAGEHTVTISGGLKYFKRSFTYRELLKSIEQWGDIAWTSMAHSFQTCNNLVSNATDSPNLCKVTDMSYMFNEATNFNGDISSWDVSNVTNFGGMFRAATNFNQPLNNWDVSNATRLSSMFDRATNFNQPLDNWDVSNVVFIGGMFSEATSFNQDLNTWDISKVTNLGAMFLRASSFNGNISGWNVSKVTDTRYMFHEATSFNGNISGWNVSSVTDMENMFYEVTSFNANISGWNVSKVTNMARMFEGAASFNQDLSNWDVSNVEFMESMFSGATSFNGNVSGWDVSNVKFMTSMFAGATSFNQNLGAWEFPMVNFGGTGLSGFLDNTAMSVENYDNTLIAWAAQSQPQFIFFSAENVKYCNSEDARLTLIFDYGWELNDGGLQCPVSPEDPFITTWETGFPNQIIAFETPGFGESNFNVDWGDGTTSSNVSGLVQHTYNTPNTYTVKISGNLKHFKVVSNSRLHSIEQWGIIEWTSMADAFKDCSNMAYNATDAPDLSNVTDMSGMFQGTAFSADLSSWNVSNVTHMNSMFSESLFNGNISNWNVSNVTDMNGMFLQAVEFNGDVSGWNVGNVENMQAMFKDAFHFNQNLGSWNLSSVTNMGIMLTQSGLNIENYDITLMGWYFNNPSLPTEQQFFPENLAYCEAGFARDALINELGWDMTGDFCGCCQPLQGNTSEISIDTPVENATIPIIMNVSPNPATDFVKIDLNRTIQKDARIVLYDQLGKVVLENIMATDNSSLNLNLSKQSLTNGIYTVTLFVVDGIVTKRLLINNN